MQTRSPLKILLLLLVLALSIGAITFFLNSETVAPLAVANSETAIGPAEKSHQMPRVTDARPAEMAVDKPPQQAMDDILDCAALLAAHESSTRGELKEDTEIFNLISYALGKAQELALEAGLNKQAARARYDQNTVDYFLEYTADPAIVANKNAGRVADCDKQLREYEPNAQIQSTINKAREMAVERN